MVYDNHGRSRRLRGANEIGRGAHKDVVSMLFGRDSRTADITTNGIKGEIAARLEEPAEHKERRNK